MNSPTGYLIVEVVTMVAMASYLFAEYVYMNTKNRVLKTISEIVYVILKVLGIIYIPCFIIKTIQLLVLIWGWE